MKKDKMLGRKENKRVIGQSQVKSYGNEPFFVKKANDSKAALEKYGIPEPLKKGVTKNN